MFRGTISIYNNNCSNRKRFSQVHSPPSIIYKTSKNAGITAPISELISIHSTWSYSTMCYTCLSSRLLESPIWKENVHNIRQQYSNNLEQNLSGVYTDYKHGQKLLKLMKITTLFPWWKFCSLCLWKVVSSSPFFNIGNKWTSTKRFTTLIRGRGVTTDEKGVCTQIQNNIFGLKKT